MKKFRIFHWDTFDNETILIGDKNTLKEAINFVEKEYAGRIDSVMGADAVDIVDEAGTIIKQFRVK